MSKYCLINDEQNYWEIEIDEGDLTTTNEYQWKTNSFVKIFTMVNHFIDVSICI